MYPSFSPVQVDPTILARISAAWSANSAQAPEAWSAANPARGQCAVTAALVQELTGLAVVRGHAILPDGSVESHYWNEGLDLTMEQFPAGTRTVVREGVQGEAAYDYLLSSPELVARLEILRARYAAIETALAA